MLDAVTFLTALPSEARVRVRIAGTELPSLAIGTDAAWSGIITGIQTDHSLTDHGRTWGENMSLTVRLSDVPGGLPPDNGEIEVMYPGETEFTKWRATGSRRRGNSMLTIVIGPLYG